LSGRISSWCAANHRCADLAFPNKCLAALPAALRPRTQSKQNLCDEIRAKIFKNYAIKSIEAVDPKHEEAILYIERNSELVKSITSFPYIVKSLCSGIGITASRDTHRPGKCPDSFSLGHHSHKPCHYVQIGRNTHFWVGEIRRTHRYRKGPDSFSIGHHSHKPCHRFQVERKTEFA
jgi:hypothetical protein